MEGRIIGAPHAPISFYILTTGYGVFVNLVQFLTYSVRIRGQKYSKNTPVTKDRNTWSLHPYFDTVEILIPVKEVELYVFGRTNSLGFAHELLNKGVRINLWTIGE